MSCSWPIGRMRIPENILVFRGIEVSTDSGHLLVYGVSDDSWNLWGRNNYLKLAKVVASVHSRGGICIPAHPFRGWESLGDQVFSFDGLDGIETHNGVNGPLQNKPAVEAALKLGLPSVSNTWLCFCFFYLVRLRIVGGPQKWYSKILLQSARSDSRTRLPRTAPATSWNRLLGHSRLWRSMVPSATPSCTLWWIASLPPEHA